MLSTDILWRVFHILTESVPYISYVYVNRRNNEARALIAMWAARTSLLRSMFVKAFTNIGHRLLNPLPYRFKRINCVHAVFICQ